MHILQPGREHLIDAHAIAQARRAVDLVVFVAIDAILGIVQRVKRPAVERPGFVDRTATVRPNEGAGGLMAHRPCLALIELRASLDGDVLSFEPTHLHVDSTAVIASLLTNREGRHKGIEAISEGIDRFQLLEQVQVVRVDLGRDQLFHAGDQLIWDRWQGSDIPLVAELDGYRFQRRIPSLRFVVVRRPALRACGC